MNSLSDTISISNANEMINKSDPEIFLENFFNWLRSGDTSTERMHFVCLVAKITDSIICHQEKSWSFARKIQPH